jgi:UDP-glucose:(heptosyl)LPS alpha-1,3-glucosyltransferase
MGKGRKKIAVVIPKYGLVGGAEGFAAKLTERCAIDSPFDFHVFANRWETGSAPVTFHRVPIVAFPKFLTTTSFAAFAARRMAEVGIDLIHTHERIWKADIFTMHGVPHRFWVDEIRRKRFRSLYDRETIRVERGIMREGKCRRYLPVSTLTRDIFLREYRVPPEKVEVLHPGVDVEIYRPLERDECRQAVRERYGIGLPETLILFVSMNFEVKGLDRLLEALAAVKTRGVPPFRLLVVGKGDYAKYGESAGRLGLKETVIFAGPVTRDELAKIYLSADVYAMLSRFDTFGMVVSEAMAASLPVLVSGCVGAKDLVREGVNGYIVEDPDRVDQIAGKLILLLNPDIRAPMTAAARKAAEAHSWDAVADRMRYLYESIFSQMIS